LFADQPAGVGFSYSDSGGYSHNETQVALYMTVFFARFYEAYPKYAKNDLFIAAESYGGHYGPSIAYGLFEANKKGASFPLKGFAIGNGLVDPLHQYSTYPDFVEKECPAETGKECVPQAGIASMKAAVPQCTKLIQECQDEISDCGEAQSFCNNAMFGPYEQTGLNPYGEQLVSARSFADHALCSSASSCHACPLYRCCWFWCAADIRIPCAVPPLCYDFSDISTFLNKPETQKAIGVDNIQWQSCNFEVNSQFSK
jgi:cathepsin A (carboxypeptidase C)